MAGFLARLSRVFKANAAYTTIGTDARNKRWKPSNVGPNAALDYAANTLRAQSRDLVRKNALASSAVDRIVSNTVGTGIKPKLTDKALADLWLRWTDESAADGQLDFYGQQQQVMASVVTAGECFIRLRNRLPQDGLSVPLQLEILEPEFVPQEKNGTSEFGGGEIRQGIEFDFQLKSKRVAYWVYPRHPADGAINGENTAVRVPASEILHVYLPARAGQIRGEPWFARVLDRMKDVDSYDKAELIRKQTAALVVGFVRRPTPDGGFSLDDLEAIYGTGDGTAEGATQINNGVGEVSMEAGSMQTLLPGEEVEFNNPPDVGGQFEVYMRAQHRSIAAALGVLYEQLTGDYSQVNDRTWRAAVNEFRRRCEGWQHHLLVFQFCRPVWKRWADMASLFRVASVDPMMPVAWTPPAWPYINPVQDIQASREAVLAGFTTRSAVVSERGEDSAAVDAENEADQSRADEMGLFYATDLTAPPEPVAPAPMPAGPDPSIKAIAEMSRDMVADVFKGLAVSQKPAAQPVSFVLDEKHFTVDATRPTFTEVEARDKDGRILSYLVKPASGNGAVMRRTASYDTRGRLAGYSDSIVEPELVDG